MAQNVFDATFDANNRIDVNSFDWSHVNNFTTNFGRITPVFCELVPAKGSLRINPEFGLELMPMVFPVQTRMFARLNFFKVTLRSMWEDYSDFISNFRDGLEEPYLLPSSQNFTSMLGTGSLGDYLGVPTRNAGNEVTLTTSVDQCSLNSMIVYGPSNSLQDVVSGLLSGSGLVKNCGRSFGDSDGRDQCASFSFSISGYNDSMRSYKVTAGIPKTNGKDKNSYSGAFIFYSGASSPVRSEDVKFVWNADTSMYEASVTFSDAQFSDVTVVISTASGVASSSYWIIGTNVASAVANVEESETTYQSTPFATQDKPANLRLLAYRFRTYESVYNAYYRDIRNNPFVVDGHPVYNKWLPTMKGGADKFSYKLHQCNWERDFLTTAVPNPQQGTNAPLVGLVMGDVVTRSEDGTYSIQKQTVLVDEDGSKYGISYKVSDDGESLVGVDYDPVSEKTPVTAINSYAELAALATQQGSGFTIETLRYVNAYQKFLELNMRKGFSYKQIMQGRWDIDIRFDELLMPEFIGGISRELSMRTVEQTVDQQSTTSQGQYAEALGSKTGIAGVYGSTSNNIEVFCDEESYIIGLLTVTPVPIYTQMLPKDFLYNGLLDHYQPEFDRIGFQPITYKEVCPLNLGVTDTVDKANQTFGYQRPWYEYVAKYDSAHGLFRTNMKNFVMSRVFSGLPQLGQQFLLVDPDTVNQVFSVTEYTDKIFGYVKFNATARLPISRVAIPRLD
uniref:Major capsid protein n=1 Tax=Microviridae sp. cttoc6 TaxID=2825009 RepID=A0A8S5TVC9_9VIRU|nr:MAG TPA: Major capsid protein [Microviridae sp. cttoc6]